MQTGANIADKLKTVAHQAIEWINARSSRERIILFGATVLAIYVAWNMLLYKPLQASVKKQRAEIIYVNEQIEKIDDEIAKIVKALDELDDQGNQEVATRAKLLEKAKILDEQLGILTSDLISPAQMITALRAMLDRQTGLKLLSLDTAPAQALQTSVANLADSKSDKVVGVGDGSIMPGIYKHEITIVLLGDYFSTLNYLRSLESLGWRLFWDSLRYEVVSYPTAQVTIKLHTLSSKKGFIGG